jgi:hypothetical protein
MAVVNGTASALSHDLDKYLEELDSEEAYFQRVEDEKKRILAELNGLVETLGDDFLYEDRNYQLSQLDVIRGRADRISQLCIEYDAVDRDGI